MIRAAMVRTGLVIGMCCGAVVATRADEAAGEAEGRSGEQTAETEDLTDMMCGPYCLWQAGYMHGWRGSLKEVMEALEFQIGVPVSITAMTEGARRMGLQPWAMRMTYDDLIAYRHMAVLVIRGRRGSQSPGHYVIGHHVDETGMWLVDGASRRWAQRGEMEAVWNGDTIVFDGRAEGSSGWRHVWRGAAACAVVCIVAVGLVWLYRKTHVSGVGRQSDNPHGPV